MTVLNTIALVLVLAAAGGVIGLAVHALVTVIRNDGYYPRRGSAASVAEPPRSHHADLFDPRSRAA